MKRQQEENDERIYPYIVFKIKNQLYSINSKYVATILQLPQFDTLPDSPDYITGIFPYRNEFIQMLDLRNLLGMTTLNQEYEVFSKMLDDRKQDHIHWVDELENCIKSERDFMLATDPHKCALGKWYDNFSSDNTSINFHLRKLNEPHQKLHEAAHQVILCTKECDSCEREECLKNVLERAKGEYMPIILQLLEETKNIFKSTIYHEMVLVLSGNNHIGIVVDEVLAVELLSKIGSLSEYTSLCNDNYVSAILKSTKISGMISEINISKILNLISINSCTC